MSIEKAIENLTTAVQENTAVQQELVGLLKAGKAAKAEAPAAAEEDAPRSRRRGADAENTETTSTRTSRRAAKEEVEAAEEAPRSRRRAEPEAEESPRRARAARAEKPKKVKLDDVKAKFATFLEVDDEKEEDDRRDFLESILDHLDVEKTADIKEADFADVIGWVEQYEAGEDVRFS